MIHDDFSSFARVQAEAVRHLDDGSRRRSRRPAGWAPRRG